MARVVKHASLAVALAIAASAGSAAASTGNFDPPANPPKLQAVRVEGAIVIDGNLDEEDWRRAPLASPFVQVDPAQGELPVGATDVRVLYDEVNLYIGAVCHDPRGESDLRAPNLLRDFNPEEQDLFGVVLDTLVDRRNAVTFQVNPFGALRDVQVFDDELRDQQWDAVWTARTTRGPWGWTVEIALPWKSLRYTPGAARFGAQFHRTLRATNEISGWSPWPRGLSSTRMSYAGYLVDIAPPQPPLNLLLRPFAIARSYQATNVQPDLAPDLGFDAKWAPYSHTSVDLTVNTDFGEAEVDRQYINLRRSAILLPERRPFFLESSSLFSLGLEEFMDPFFSRRIGLTADGRRVPMDFGARFVTRTNNQSAGGLVVRTRGTAEGPASTFAVARYSQNLGEQSRVGWFLSMRHDEAFGAQKETLNVVPAVDGLARFGLLTLRGLASTSYTNGPGKPAGFLSAEAKGNFGGIGTSAAYVAERYDPRTGIVARSNVLFNQTYYWLDWRPDWKPKGIRSIQSEFYNGLYHDAAHLGFQETNLYFEPLGFLFDTTDEVTFKGQYDMQRLSEPFAPLSDVTIPAGDYNYGWVGVNLKSDPSRKLSAELEVQTGSYYVSKYQALNATLRASPIPNFSLLVSHQVNRFDDVPDLRGPLFTHLFRTEARVAFSPRVQFATIVQYNSDLALVTGNARFSWEFQPLSFFYIVYSDFSRGRNEEGLPRREQQLTFKATYAWQL
jgi:hypothetical protein